MRRGVLLLALALTAVGCTDARQRAAVRAVEARVGGKATCTKSPRIANTTVFLCDVKRADGLCDRYRAVVTRHGFDVRLAARRVGCVLPPT
jgi:hypothetical protein